MITKSDTNISKKNKKVDTIKSFYSKIEVFGGIASISGVRFGLKIDITKHISTEFFMVF